MNSKAIRTHIMRTAIIAVVYAFLTIVCTLIDGSLSWAPIQLRFSEALCVLAFFTSDAVPGLAIGCAIANLANLGISGLGSFTAFGLVFGLLVTIAGSLFAWKYRGHIAIAALGPLVANVIVALLVYRSFGSMGVLDVVFGSLATAIGAVFAWRHREHPPIAAAGPVIANALIIPAYLPLMLADASFYTIPFTGVAIGESYLLRYLFGVITIGVGEAIVMYALGLPLARALKDTEFARRLLRDDLAGNLT